MYTYYCARCCKELTFATEMGNPVFCTKCLKEYNNTMEILEGDYPD